MMTNGRFSWRRLVDIATPFLCLTLLLWAVAAAPAAYAACGPRFVTTGGSDAGANDCLTVGSPCKTIQYAIDQACAADTINVAAGIYVETVTAGHGSASTFPGIDINKAVVLKGAGAASTTIRADGGHLQPTVAVGPLSAVTLSSPGITIDGFTILETNVVVNLITADGAVNSNNHIIKNNVITNPTFDDGGAGGGWGILLGFGPSSNNQITGNDIRLNPILATNEFTFGIWDGAAGQTGGPSNNNVINGNTIHNVGIGIILDPGTGNVVSGNQITDNAFSGIYHYGDTGTQVTFNSFLRNHASGIQVRWGATNIVVTGNCFQDNGVNPVTYPDTTTDVARGAIRIADDTDPNTSIVYSTTGTQIHDNNFAGDLPFGVENDSSASSAAELNWWGCAAGPGNLGCDAVTGPVNFIPVLSAPSATPPCSCTTDAQCPVDSNPCTDAPVCLPVVDVAQGKVATQSSNVSGADVCGGPPLASRAVDGNTDGNYYDCSVSHTGIELQPWWQVDLAASQDIASIKVWNRTDCCGDRLVNYHVFVSNQVALLSAGNVVSAQAVADHDFFVAAQAGTPTTIVVNFPGRYVRVQLAGTNYLQLAEVQVIAGGCVQPNNTLPCDDGLSCNGTDTCSGGVCTHTGDPCLPGTVCNITCQEAPLGTFTCFDPAGTVCTSDGNVCTDDQCDGLGACLNTNNSAPCNDNLVCNGADTCSAGTCSVHDHPCVPTTTTGVELGSTSVTGFAQPGLANGCVQIMSCNGAVCFDANDFQIGSGGTDPITGKFTITVSPALACGEKIYAVVVCGPGAPIFGPVAVVLCPPVPVLSPQAILFLVASLGMVGLFGLRRVTPRR
jgi:parallel beta-helix repeat protein